MSEAGFNFETATRRGELHSDWVLHAWEIRELIEARFEMRSFARSGDTRTDGISAEPLATDVPV